MALDPPKADCVAPAVHRRRDFGDRQTGKTAVALDTIINQRETGVVCVYCAVGQRNAAVARLIADLRKYGALANAVVVVALGEDPPGIQYHQSHLHHRRPDLSFARPVPAGVLPAIDVGRSVSRVGGKTQLPAYRTVAGDLRLAYTQFEELEAFARFGTRLDDETQQTLERGRRVRAVLQQPQYQPIPAPEQIAVLLAVTEGIFDELPVEQIRTAETAVREEVTRTQPDICRHIAQGRPLSDSDRADLLRSARQAIESAGLTQETSSQ